LCILYLLRLRKSGVPMNEELKGEIRIYRAEAGKTTLEVSLKEDTVCLVELKS